MKSGGQTLDFAAPSGMPLPNLRLCTLVSLALFQRGEQLRSPLKIADTKSYVYVTVFERRDFGPDDGRGRRDLYNV